MTIDQLYKTYGEQMVSLEILQSQIGQTKQALANEMNKPKLVVPEVPSE